MDKPVSGLAALGRRRKTPFERAGLDPEVIAMQNLRYPTLEGSGRMFEAGKDVADYFAKIWNKSGIVAGFRVDKRDRDGVHARAVDMSKLIVKATGVIKEGDLVSVFHGEEPGFENQHLRVVASLETRSSRDGTPYDRVTLGPALALNALPENFKFIGALTTLCIDRKDDKLSVRDGAGNILSTFTGASFHDGDFLENRIDRLIDSCADAGRKAKRTGEENGVRKLLDIVPSTDEKGRCWNLVNKDGRIYESAPRSVMERKPPANLREMFHIGTSAYEEAFNVNIPLREKRPPPVELPPVDPDTTFTVPCP